MNRMLPDTNLELMVDGNAVAGLLGDIFHADITACQTQCGFCGEQGEIGALLAFTHAPGVVLRCPGCHNVLFRIVQTPTSIYLDMRGVNFLILGK